MSVPEDRYSILRPLNVETQKNLTIEILSFFNILHAAKMREELGLPKLEGRVEPLSLGQFYQWKRKSPQGESYNRLRMHIGEIVNALVRGGLMSHEGRNRSGALGDANTYYAGLERTTGASRGTLFLGKALGASYIAQEIQKGLVAISGKTGNGDIAVGTGVHVHPKYIVTCDHVIRDMVVDEKLIVAGVTVSVVECLINLEAGVDVGAIRFEPEVPLALPDLQFREGHLLEEILIAGFPTVPTTIERVVTFQHGEICQTSVPTMFKTNLDLFSAIARPGNSGGPLVTREGNIVGLVTQSLEREKETADYTQVFPFFAAVPANDVRREFEKLTGVVLPWESYQ